MKIIDARITRYWWVPLAAACAFVAGTTPGAAQENENFQDFANNEYYSGYYDDDSYVDDWYYDYYDDGFDTVADGYGEDWYDNEWWGENSYYDGLYNDENDADDWFYDEYESGHYDVTGYDDAGEEGLFDW